MSVPVHSRELTLSLGQWGQVAGRKQIGSGECKGREEQNEIKRRERRGKEREEGEGRRGGREERDEEEESRKMVQ